MKKYYTIYKIDKETKDITNVMDYERAEDVQKSYGLANKKSIYNYLVKDIESIYDKDNNFNIKNLLKNNYFIMINED